MAPLVTEAKIPLIMMNAVHRLHHDEVAVYRPRVVFRLAVVYPLGNWAAATRH